MTEHTRILRAVIQERRAASHDSGIGKMCAEFERITGCSMSGFRLPHRIRYFSELRDGATFRHADDPRHVAVKLRSTVIGGGCVNAVDLRTGVLSGCGPNVSVVRLRRKSK